MAATTTSTTAASATSIPPPPLTKPSSTATPPQIQFLHHQPPSSIQTHLHPYLGKPSNTIRYPLTYSGRGLIHPQLPEPVLTYPQIPNSNHNSRPLPTNPIVRPPFSHPSQGPVSYVPASTVVGRGVQFNNTHHPLSKVGSSPYCVRESNGPKDLIDKKPDDPLVTVRDRKVRVSDGASLYAICRSWLRNEYPEDIQPQYGDVLISLPKPLPLPESSSPKRKEHDDEIEVDEA